VLEDAAYHCGYCPTSQRITAMPMHVEHIIPLAVGGTSAEENLWLACPLCNGYKGIRTHYTDPETGEEALLFNPRGQV
jgi:5-methylcytosine-specific restriction endonuclease McrA